MENLKWRSPVKIVGWAHICWISLGLIWAIWLVTLVTLNAESKKHIVRRTYLHHDDEDSTVNPASEDKNEKVEKTFHLTITLLWILVAMLIFSTAIELWATIKLLIATKSNTGANECMRKCKAWLIVTIIMLFFGLANNLLFRATLVERAKYTVIFCDIIFRGIFLVVVAQFMKEVKPHAI